MAESKRNETGGHALGKTIRRDSGKPCKSGGEESVLITGATGSGKSCQTSALGHEACLLEFKAAYFNTQKLMLKTKMGRWRARQSSYSTALQNGPADNG